MSTQAIADSEALATTQPIAVYPSIDDALGAAADRYFGAGYRRVTQQLAGLRWSSESAGEPGPLPGHPAVGTGAVHYPVDWSHKRTATPLQPHLSSVDALVLGIRLVEAHLVNSFALDADQVSRGWLRRYVMRCGPVAQTALADIPLVVTERGSVPSQITPGWVASRFDCDIGVMSVRFEIEHEPAARRSPTRVGCELLLPAAPYYSGGYRNQSHQIRAVTVDQLDRSASATDCVPAPGPAAAIGSEIGAAYQPGPTMVDAVVVIAQLAQTLLYSLDGLSRADTNTLWMRMITMSQDQPLPTAADTVRCSTRVNRSNVVDLAGARWRASNLTGGYGGIDVQYAVGHRLPEKASE